MMSRTSKAFTQMSLRTGMPISNHGMVPVYHPRGGGCGCNNSIFGQNNFYMRPMGHGCNNSLFRAGMITNMVLGCCDCAMNWIGQILNWCGIGGGGQRSEQPTQDDADLKLLQNTLKDTDKLDYEVVKNSDGTYSVTVRDKEHPENNQFISGTKETILKELGYTSGPRETTKKEGNKPTVDDVKAKIAEAMKATTDGLKIPEGYGEPVITIGNDNKITVKYSANGKYPIEITSDSIDNVVSDLKAAVGKVNLQNETKAKIDEAKTKEGDEQLNIPDGYGDPEITVGDDNKITVKYSADGKLDIEVTVDKPADIVDALKEAAEGIESRNEILADINEQIEADEDLSNDLEGYDKRDIEENDNSITVTFKGDGKKDITIVIDNTESAAEKITKAISAATTITAWRDGKLSLNDPLRGLDEKIDKDNGEKLIGTHMTITNSDGEEVMHEGFAICDSSGNIIERNGKQLIASSLQDLATLLG